MPKKHSVYRDIFILSTPIIVIGWIALSLAGMTYGGRGFTIDYAGLTGYESMSVLGGLFGSWLGAVAGHLLAGMRKMRLNVVGYLVSSLCAFLMLAILFAFASVQTSYLWYFVAFSLIAIVHFFYRYFSIPRA